MLMLRTFANPRLDRRELLRVDWTSLLAGSLSIDERMEAIAVERASSRGF